MTDTPDYYVLGEYDQPRNSFVPEKAVAKSGGKTAARLFPADFGHFFASQTFWDPLQSRRLVAGWVVNTNNTQGMLREVAVVPDEDEGGGAAGRHSMRFHPVNEAASLRVSNTARSVRLGGKAVISAEGFQQMDIVATFSAPVSGWESFSSASAAPCSFVWREAEPGRRGW